LGDRRTAGGEKDGPNSPRINLALGKHYRLKGDNTLHCSPSQKAILITRKCFLRRWAARSGTSFIPSQTGTRSSNGRKTAAFDRYQVAGFIRQETIFDPKAKSGANAYGLMQLLLPTARTVARSIRRFFVPTSGTDLYQPALKHRARHGILKDQFAKFGRIEYVAVAYNAARAASRNGVRPCRLRSTSLSRRYPLKKQKATSRASSAIPPSTAGSMTITATLSQMSEPAAAWRDRLKPRDQFTAEFPEVIVDDNQSGS
jgi:hypothetical protein